MKKNTTQFILFTLEYPPQKGGVAAYYNNLAKHWPLENLTILTNSEIPGEKSKNIITRRLISRYLRPRWLPALFHLYKTLATGHWPISNTHVVVGQILPLGIAAYYLAKFFKFEYSVVLHGLDFTLALSRKKIAGKILTNATKIICANSHTASLVRFFDSALGEKICVVNPGIDPNFVRNPSKVKELREKYSLADKKILFSLGRLVKRKGFDKIIQAMEITSLKEPNLILAIGGSGPEGVELKKIIAKLPKNIQEKIITLGHLSDEEYWAWLELCDIFIMTSRDINGDYEGFGIVYLEANLAGKPVIAGDSGGVRDAVLNNVNGLLVDPESTEAIASAVISLANNESLRQELGAQGNRRTVETMSAKKQTEKFYNALNDIKI